MEFWNEIITDKSFKVLQELKKRFKFVLIGGWAIFILTKSIKSKDIDIIVDFETLAQKFLKLLCFGKRLKHV